MAVSFEDAVDTLHGMFSSYDKSSLGRMLQQHDYHMENTVEHILRLESSPDAVAGNDTSGDEDLARRLNDELNAPTVQQPGLQPAPVGYMLPNGQIVLNGAGNGAAAAGAAAAGGGATPGPKGRGSSVTLPEDFLRVPGTGSSQLLSDEQLARMLADSLFLEEMQRDEELSRYVGGRGAPSAAPSSAAGRGPSPAGPSGPSMMDRLNSMGKGAKAKLNELAMKFNRRNRSGNLDGVNYEHVPLNSGALVDEDDEVDIAFDNAIQMDAIRSPMMDAGAQGQPKPADDYDFVPGLAGRTK